MCLVIILKKKSEDSTSLYPPTAVTEMHYKYKFNGDYSAEYAQLIFLLIFNSIIYVDK